MIGLLICTSECNLSCKYCYEHTGRPLRRRGRTEISSMFCQAQETILEYAAVLSALAKACGRTSQFILHGGEALLLREEVLIPFLAKLSSAGCDALQIQTNGTQVTPVLANAFAQYGISVVMSIDGPEAIHNAFRVNGGGQGTFRRVMESVHLLQAQNVPVSALATITSRALGRAQELYDFFNGERLDFSVNRCFPVSSAPSDAGLKEESYAGFLAELFDRYREQGSGDVRILCFDRCLHDLKEAGEGYVYVPRTSPYISAYHVESRTFRFIDGETVRSSPNLDSFLNYVLKTLKRIPTEERRTYSGPLRNAVIEHLCWLQTGDFRVAAEINL